MSPDPVKEKKANVEEDDYGKNNLALSQITHHTCCTLKPHTWHHEEGGKILFNNCLWNDGPDEITINLIVQNYDKKHLKMIEVLRFVHRFKLTCIKSAITADRK